MGRRCQYHAAELKTNSSLLWSWFCRCCWTARHFLLFARKTGFWPENRGLTGKTWFSLHTSVLIVHLVHGHGSVCPSWPSLCLVILARAICLAMFYRAWPWPSPWPSTYLDTYNKKCFILLGMKLICPFIFTLKNYDLISSIFFTANGLCDVSELLKIWID